ncbi:MAG TPA: LysR family transcriptional regulator [Labilithrix sp.]
MQWDDIHVILALLRARNLHDAGARLEVDGSTVSRRLAAIEKRLGARLFARTRDGLRPTAAAERLRPHAEAMEAEASALVQAARAVETRATGAVRIATTEAMARMLVSEGLLAVRRDHPELAIELLAGNVNVDLARGEADIALRVSAPRGPSLRVRCLARMPIGLFAAGAYLRARGEVRSPASLRGHDVLLPSGELARLPETQWLASRPGVRVVFRSNCMPALLAAALDGQGITPLPVVWGDAEPGLERILVIAAVPKRPVWLVTHEASSGRAGVRVVSERIATIFARTFR